MKKYGIVDVMASLLPFQLGRMSSRERLALSSPSAQNFAVVMLVA